MAGRSDRPSGRTEQLGQRLEAFDNRLSELVIRSRAVPERVALARHSRNHFAPWLVFAPRIEPTNGLAERAIRVINDRTNPASRRVGFSD